MNADVDAILYTQVQSRPGHGLHPLFDEGIPFWQLTFHGIVMSNVSSQTVNYPAKEKMQHLKFLEYGGRPLMYFYSKFGDDRNWMGDIDLHADTEADIDQAVEMIKIAADEYDQNQSLQYAFMENHEKISENRYRSTSRTVRLLPWTMIRKPMRLLVRKCRIWLETVVFGNKMTVQFENWHTKRTRFGSFFGKWHL